MVPRKMVPLGDIPAARAEFLSGNRRRKFFCGFMVPRNMVPFADISTASIEEIEGKNFVCGVMVPRKMVPLADITAARAEGDTSWRKWYPLRNTHPQRGGFGLSGLSRRTTGKATDCHDPVIIIRCFHLGEVLLAWLNLGHTVRDIGCCFSLSSLVLSCFGKGMLPQLVDMIGLAAQVIHGSVWSPKGCPTIPGMGKLLPAGRFYPPPRIEF
ncbi:uncharacterized protein CEXT_616801 [Caerostris extrusa]|uniref:Uncharacterized protein n=1 Tax=Caerostris extrusa TaxID=172846 RepID=A0AAV4MME9_CAEEX|nr:uncharacterized protein CEXT_616801 [Caerostris extrusa]